MDSTVDLGLAWALGEPSGSAEQVGSGTTVADPMPAIEVTFLPDISGARCEPITVEIDADVVWESMPSRLTAAELRQACEDSQPLAEQLAMHVYEDLPVWMDLVVCEWEWVRLAVDVANPCYGQAEALPGIAPPPKSVRITWPEVAA